MRYSIIIDNIHSLKWDLNIQEAYLFGWIYTLPSWADSIIIEGETYFFASKNKAIEELPILTKKIDTIYRFYKSLELKGLISIKKLDGKDFLALTEKAKSWGQSDNSEKNPTETRKKIREDSEKNPTYNINNTIKQNNSINNITKTENLEKTLNEKVEDPKISYVEFAKEFPQEKKWESPNIKNSNFKQKEKIEIIQKELKEFIDYWNQNFGTRYKYLPTLQKNLSFWLEHYSMEDIFEAISMIKFDNFWKTKLDPTTFLRQKNPSGENVDRIGQFKNLIIDENEIMKNMTGNQKVDYLMRKEARQKQELENLI